MKKSRGTISLRCLRLHWRLLRRCLGWLFAWDKVELGFKKRSTLVALSGVRRKDYFIEIYFRTVVPAFLSAT